MPVLCCQNSYSSNRTFTTANFYKWTPRIPHYMEWEACLLVDPCKTHLVLPLPTQVNTSEQIGMTAMPSTISEPPPAYTSSPPLHRSHTAYQRLPKDEMSYDPITGERIRRYGFLNRSARVKRQKMWCLLLLAIVLIMIALIIAGAVYHLGREDDLNDNGTDDCHESLLNGFDCN